VRNKVTAYSGKSYNCQDSFEKYGNILDIHM